MEAWYAIHTKARQEQIAAAQLARQHYQSYLPLLRAPKRRRGRWREVIEPLFPGYLFVRLDLAGQNTAPIRSTRGVIGMVRFGNKALPVSETLIERLQATGVDGDGAIRRVTLFNPGDRVEIVSGPLAGLDAIFLSSSGPERAHLLLGLLGRNNRVELSPHQLVPTSR